MDKIDFKKTGWLAIKKNNLAPNFTAEDINGEIVSLSRLRGKYVLLDFWATWCGPCMEEVPFINKIRSDYPVSKLAVIGVSSDNNYNKFLKGVLVNKMNWTHIYDNERINTLYGADALPTTYLIDEKGIIVFSSKEDDNKVFVEMLKKIK